MQHVFDIDGVEHGVTLSRDGAAYTLHLSDGDVKISLAGGLLNIDGSETPVRIAHDGARLFIHVDGDAHEIAYRDPVARHAARAGSGAHDVIRAPMPGVVVALTAREGQHVENGDPLLVIESMKLETAIRAPRAGVVETVHVALNGGFERDAALVSLAPLEVAS